MENIPSLPRRRTILITVVVVVVAAIIVGIIFWIRAEKGPGTANSNSAAVADSSTAALAAGTDASATSPGSAAPTSGNAADSSGTPAAPIPAPVAPFVINLITPVAGDQWQIGSDEPVSWDHAPGITGEIDLLDAKTKAEIGVILSEIGPNQTSYTWNTRDVYLGRYNALKKDVTPGTYVIQLQFDGNNLPDLVSAPFSITN